MEQWRLSLLSLLLFFIKSCSLTLLSTWLLQNGEFMVTSSSLTCNLLQQHSNRIQTCADAVYRLGFACACVGSHLIHFHSCAAFQLSHHASHVWAECSLVASVAFCSAPPFMSGLFLPDQLVVQKGGCHLLNDMNSTNMKLILNCTLHTLNHSFIVHKTKNDFVLF